jgi:hypothetical protein
MVVALESDLFSLASSKWSCIQISKRRYKLSPWSQELSDSKTFLAWYVRICTLCLIYLIWGQMT